MIKKITRRFALVLLFVSLSLFSQAQEQEKEGFVKGLAEILKTKNEQAYLRLFPDYPKMLVLMKELMAGSGQQMDSSFARFFTEDAYQKEMMGEMGEKFRKFIQKGEEKGIAWDKTSLVSYTLEMKAEDQDDDAMNTNLKMYTGEMELQAADKSYIVRFKESLWWEADKKFYGAEMKKVFEKGKEEAEEEEWEDAVAVDSAMAVMADTFAVAEPVPPPAPKKKPAAPAKTKTTVKPKTPARKPKS